MNQKIQQTKTNQIIDNFREYLEFELNVKSKTMADLESGNFDDTSKEWYKGQMVEIQNIKRNFELIVLEARLN